MNIKMKNPKINDFKLVLFLIDLIKKIDKIIIIIGETKANNGAAIPNKKIIISKISFAM